MRKILKESRPSAEESLPAEQKIKVWFDLLGKYSTSSLTLESDRLFAVAGLALRVGQSLKITYLAGLWKEDLPYCLLWCVKRTPPRQRSYRMAEYSPS